MGAPRLDYITIKGFKSIASVEKLKLQPINVLIGPNGSGKSNFIAVFAFLHAIQQGRLQDYVAKAGYAHKLLHFGPKATQAIALDVSFKSSLSQHEEYSIRLEVAGMDELFPQNETITYLDRQGRARERRLARIGKEAGISDPDYPRFSVWARIHLGHWRIYHFHDTSPLSPMKRASNVNDNRFLREDASNLAAFLHLLRAKQKDAYGLIRRTVQLVTPFFDDFRLDPDNGNPDQIRLEWRHKNSDEYFDATSLSDGTLRFIALATLFLQPEEYRPSVILVDEPELGLHPCAITLLASMVKMAAAKTQVIIATQSPTLLDHFAPEDVLVTERVGGGTQIARLSAEKLKAWLEDYSLGQLWEMNELGGRPSGE